MSNLDINTPRGQETLHVDGRAVEEPPSADKTTRRRAPLHKALIVLKLATLDTFRGSFKSG
jgi:hypothetical protein